MIETTRRPWRILILFFLLALIAAACGSASQQPQVAIGVLELPLASTDQVDNTGRGPQMGELAPDLLMTSSNDSSQKLSDWQGRPIVINFWATWCAPCRAEMPELVKAYEAHREEGLVVLGINQQESAEQASKFIEEFGMTFPVTLDSRGEIQQLYQVRGLPTTVFVDREGRIAVRWAGLLTEDLLQEYLSEIM